MGRATLPERRKSPERIRPHLSVCEKNKVCGTTVFLTHSTAKVFDNQDIVQVALPVHRLR
jgi:hypothetical protein